MILDCGVEANRGAKIIDPKKRVIGRAVSSRSHKGVELGVLVEGELAGVSDYLLRLGGRG